MKQCSRCKEIKTQEHFNKDKRTKTGLTCHCKSCVAYYCKTRNGKLDRKSINAQASIWKKNNPDKVRAQQIKQNFGLSYDAYLNMLVSQNHSCAICKTHIIPYGSKQETDMIANVDHCHTTGRVRGLLCRRCNTALGLFKDNSTAIRLAADYLEKDIK